MKLMSLALGLLVSMNVFAADIVGQWTTIDDSTNAPKSIVEIYEKDGKLFGKINKIYVKPGESEDKVCEKCKGDLKDKKIVGMEILQNFQRKSDTQWEKGTILDPSSGKVYSCNLELINGGAELKVRGYIGISLIGRTQIWKKNN